MLNSTENEEKYFRQKLNEPCVSTITTNTTNVYERCIFRTTIFQTYSASSFRQDIYLSGGIVFVTTRILVVDMLKKRLPIEKITGIVVLRAHSVFESCQEALVLRLYRQNNKVNIICFIDVISVVCI